MTYIVAVGGESCAGKTTVAPALCSMFRQNGVQAEVLPLDFFYRDLSALGFTSAERKDLELGLEITPEVAARLGIRPGGLPYSFDHIENFEWAQYRKALQDICQGNALRRPQYAYDIHGYPDDAKEHYLPPHLDVLVTEGLYVLDKTRADFDFGVYVRAPAEEILRRRIRRDVRERGRTEEQVRAQMKATVIPASRRWVKPTQQHADVTLDWHGKDEGELLEMLVRQVARPVYQIVRDRGEIRSCSVPLFPQ